MPRSIPLFSASAIVLAGAFLCIYLLTPAFAVGTMITEHPAVAFCAAMVIAGLAWLSLLPILRRFKLSPKISVPAIIFPAVFVLGVLLRILLFGSESVYENDYRRYLWDGAVTANGANPYEYSPSEIYEASKPGASSVPSLARLAVLSNVEADGLTNDINSPVLTTIYPPAAQGVFALAYWIAPFKLWALKLVFLFFELLGLAALLAGLRARGLPLSWSALYWLNPIIIFTTYNGVHMDVLLVAPILSALLWSQRRPIIAALMLSLAAAIKIWPLLLAPVLFRQWRDKPVIYFGIAGLIAVLTSLSLLPMILSLDESAGIVAYSANWVNSSFLFPGVRDALGLFIEDPNRAARYVIAAILTGFSLWLGFITPKDPERVPSHLLLLAAALVFLSPTGYPWYFIWFLMFLPFAVSHWSARGLALLTIGAAAYFARFKMGEAGHYNIYIRVLLPLEFGIPLAVLMWDGLKARSRV